MLGDISALSLTSPERKPGVAGCIRPAPHEQFTKPVRKTTIASPRGEDPVNSLTTTTTVNSRNIYRFCRNISLAFALVPALVVLLLSAASPAQAQKTLIYSFGPSPAGASPVASLVLDSMGNLYGTTLDGGADRFGTVFKITPSGAETVLHSFPANSLDGALPEAGLVMDSNGNLYGTTSSGGVHGVGTVFEVTSTGTETVLYSFTGGPDGGIPYGGLVLDS